MDSLRYWIEAMHVDGFRFDLASVLGRSEDGSFRSTAPFFDAVSQDPVLNRAILIAEPWDIGTYQVGNFPVDWSEWNGRFRDTVRRFVKGDAGQLADLGWRLTGSADMYGDDGRSAYNSVNFITCHDGFTLNDLVSYNRKHNEPNQENNNDGCNDNNSWNCGVEGETERSVRARAAAAADEEPRVPAAVRLGHADDPGRRRVRAHPAGQQQRVLPGQRDQLVRLGRRLAQPRPRRVLQEGHRVRAPVPGPAAAEVRRLGADLDDDGVPDLTVVRARRGRSPLERP